MAAWGGDDTRQDRGQAPGLAAASPRADGIPVRPAHCLAPRPPRLRLSKPRALGPARVRARSQQALRGGLEDPHRDTSRTHCPPRLPALTPPAPGPRLTLGLRPAGPRRERPHLQRLLPPVPCHEADQAAEPRGGRAHAALDFHQVLPGAQPRPPRAPPTPGSPLILGPLSMHPAGTPPTHGTPPTAGPRPPCDHAHRTPAHSGPHPPTGPHPRDPAYPCDPPHPWDSVHPGSPRTQGTLAHPRDCIRMGYGDIRATLGVAHGPQVPGELRKGPVPGARWSPAP